MSITTMAQDASTSKYKPGFVFWMHGARTKVTLIEQFRLVDEPGFMSVTFKTGDKKADSVMLAHAKEFWSRRIWRAKLEYDNQGYPDTIEIGQVDDEIIDLNTGKAFQWRGNGGKVIYYDSIEYCVSTKADSPK